MKTSYPSNPRSLRPFRIWNAKTKALVPHRNYAFSWTAIAGAWEELQWMPAHAALEVFDITTGNHLATFTRGIAGRFERWVKPAYNVRFDRKKVKQRRANAQKAKRRSKSAQSIAQREAV